MPAVYNADDTSASTTTAPSGVTYAGGQLSAEEINSEKWLYIALMTTLTIGYVHLMIFAALIVIFLVYSVGTCCMDQNEAQSQVGHLSPVKLWLFIDEGIFSLLDDLDEIDQFEELNRPDEESREAAERRLALQKLEMKPFETVRLDTID